MILVALEPEMGRDPGRAARLIPRPTGVIENPVDRLAGVFEFGVVESFGCGRVPVPVMAVGGVGARSGRRGVAVGEITVFAIGRLAVRVVVGRRA